jgi:hypothetical protein
MSVFRGMRSQEPIAPETVRVADPHSGVLMPVLRRIPKKMAYGTH